MPSIPRSVFGKALLDQRKSTLWWTLGAVLITAWVAAMFPAMRDSPAMKEFLEKMPPAMMALFGMNSELFMSGAGFLQGQLYSFVTPLAMIGFAVASGAAATAGEERLGTMDMLLSLPISRRSILLQKAGAVALMTGLFVSALIITLLICNPVFGLKLTTSGILSANLGLYFLGLLFAGLAMAVGSLTGTPAAALGLGALFGLASWFVTGFARMYSWLELPASISPMGWYGQHQPLLGHWSFSLVWLGALAILFLSLALFFFERRDIASEMSVLPEAARALRPSKRVEARATFLLTSPLGKLLWELRKSIWLWSAALIFLALATFGAWPSISASAESLEGVMKSIPKELLAMFGMTDASAMATPAGFISSRAYLSVGPIVIVFFCVGGVSKLIARAEAEGIMDLVLANGQSRRRLLIQSIAGLAIATFFIVFLLMLSVLLGNQIWDTGLALEHIVGANLGLALLGLCFAGMALALWSHFGPRGPGLRIAVGLIVATYFMNGLGSLSASIEFLRYLSPFYWYLGDSVPLGRGVPPSYGALLGLALVTSLIALARFERRDLGK